MIFLCRRICSEGIFPHHAFNSLLVTGEFTIGKEADDYYDDKNDYEVFHNPRFLRLYRPPEEKNQSEDTGFSSPGQRFYVPLPLAFILPDQAEFSLLVKSLFKNGL